MVRWKKDPRPRHERGLLVGLELGDLSLGRRSRVDLQIHVHEHLPRLQCVGDLIISRCEFLKNGQGSRLKCSISDHQLLSLQNQISLPSGWLYASSVCVSGVE